jgi:hypothetical protein
LVSCGVGIRCGDRETVFRFNSIFPSAIISV